MRRTWPLMLLVGCGWNHLPQQSEVWLEAPLWDPVGVVATTDGLYVPLPSSGGLALVPPDGEAAPVDLGEGRLTQLSAVPDQTRVIAFVERYRCDEDDPRELRKIDTPDDCPADQLLIETEVNVLAEGETTVEIDVDGRYTDVTYSSDGRFAIATIDLGDGAIGRGVIDLTSVIVIDLESNSSTPVSVGFAADQVLFQEDDVGVVTGAVVLSQSAVALINLSGDEPFVDVLYHLTLDPDAVIDPVGVELTPNGEHALISVENSSDLYALDLVDEAVNIVELTSRPSDMAVCVQADRTVLVYSSSSVVDILDHAFFDIQTLQLDEAMTRITRAGDEVLLWADGGGKDLYRLDPASARLTEYRLENPPVSVHVAPTAEFAIALTRAENGFGTGISGLYDASPGMEILDLSDDDTQPFLLEGLGLGVAFSEQAGRLDALVLQQGQTYLYQLDLYTGQAQEVEMDLTPLSIGALPGDGRFYITHDAPLGAISFLDPVTGTLTTATGFGSFGLLDDIALLEEDEEAP